MRNWKSDYENLKVRLKQKGYTVCETEGRLHDYAGMNHEAAKDFGFPSKGNKCFEIDKTLTYEIKYKTLVHEVNEFAKMREGDSYWQAHKYALKNELDAKEL